MRKAWTMVAVLALTLLSGCGYNTLQTTDEQIKSSWSEVINQYQRRADLVRTCGGGRASPTRKKVLTASRSRARVGPIQATRRWSNPEAFASSGSPGELSGALSRLLVVARITPSDRRKFRVPAQPRDRDRITVAPPVHPAWRIQLTVSLSVKPPAWRSAQTRRTYVENEREISMPQSNFVQDSDPGCRPCFVA